MSAEKNEPVSLSASGPPLTSPEELRDLVRLSMFAALIGAGALIYIPFGPLFLSLQTMMVMLTGFMLGPKKAGLAILVYLACGFIGLPMFGRGRTGPASFIGPTAGYFPGFAAGAMIAGLSTYVKGSRTRRLAAMILCGLVGTVVLLAMGSVGLRLTVIGDWGKAFAVGMYPFLPGDFAKMIAAALIKESFFPVREETREGADA